ncbi:hypothetical protein F53441_6872 [Fusarium austroafricanum]|uniref:Uncharacterized protein n=1 Tax=Fusarium austroafricanum TaxID=2364996 RepID=A0A8H4KIP2_9HYPO|nr:hypothetical protein F53441_6872 [Fusarium austroafricanum]
MNDVYHFAGAISEQSRKIQREYEDLGHITIKFTTESVKPGQSTNEVTNFWERQASEVLQDPFRKYLKDAGKMPYFYEYFVIFPGNKLPLPPKIEYDTWTHGHEATSIEDTTCQILSLLSTGREGYLKNNFLISRSISRCMLLKS